MDDRESYLFFEKLSTDDKTHIAKIKTLLACAHKGLITHKSGQVSIITSPPDGTSCSGMSIKCTSVGEIVDIDVAPDNPEFLLFCLSVAEIHKPESKHYADCAQKFLLQE
ncbi:MAG: hypothetical protein AAB589_01310 [Patescibacteria group bacterium]